MASSRVVYSSPEHMLRVLHGHLQKKRSGLKGLLVLIDEIQQHRQIAPEAAQTIRVHVRSLIRSDEELTSTEREILERDERYERILRDRFPMLSDALLIVCICALDGLTTPETASIVARSVKTVEHYRQEIRELIGAKGSTKSLRELLEEVVSA